ncbi:hypothetical protein BKA62DRAFT_767333 [Auriculariales sp. MPI-PUGE-AT-0066]|nr:hypothetical protein BKA62DRAFT_767333 [Auriculariales sp. MPI-PUGE-AT-0066]
MTRSLVLAIAIHTYSILVTVWLSAGVAADVVIAMALLYESGRVQLFFNLLRQLMRMTIASGSFTTLFAVFALSTYLASPSTNYCLVFAICIGRASTLAVLYDMNERKSAQSGLSSNSTTRQIDTKTVGTTGIGVH